MGKVKEFNGGKWEFVGEIKDLWEKMREIGKDLSGQ